MNRAAQQLGRKGKGKPKTMTDAAMQQRRATCTMLLTIIQRQVPVNKTWNETPTHLRSKLHGTQLDSQEKWDKASPADRLDVIKKVYGGLRAQDRTRKCE